jgi:hypothetical protein
VDNSIGNLARGTVASNYWTDTSLTNQIVDPLLGGISRSNFVTFLDPRPKAGSPALTGSASTPGGLTPVSYRGAFAAGRGNWAADWTALNGYYILSGAGGINPLPYTPSGSVATPPTPFTLTKSPSGSSLLVTYPSQTGFSYQLRSATNLNPPAVWVDEGGPLAGTGGTLTNIVPTSGTQKFLRVLAY